LVIKEDDLAGGHCPECYEERGERRSDFEEVKETADEVKYRCEDCGIIIVSPDKIRKDKTKGKR